MNEKSIYISTTVEVGKSFFDSELKKYSYLNIKDSRVIITVSDPFFQEILELCSEATPIMIKMLYLISSSVIVSLIRVENRLVSRDMSLKFSRQAPSLVEPL